MIMYACVKFGWDEKSYSDYFVVFFQLSSPPTTLKNNGPFNLEPDVYNIILIL